MTDFNWIIIDSREQTHKGIRTTVSFHALTLRHDLIKLFSFLGKMGNANSRSRGVSASVPTTASKAPLLIINQIPKKTRKTTSDATEVTLLVFVNWNWLYLHDRVQIICPRRQEALMSERRTSSQLFRNRNSQTRMGTQIFMSKVMFLLESKQQTQSWG